jgi:hypothetical protein
MKRKNYICVFLVVLLSFSVNAFADIIASNEWYVYEANGQRVLFTPVPVLEPGTYIVKSSLLLSNKKQANWMIDLYSGIDFDWAEYDIRANFENGKAETENKWIITDLRTNVMLRLFGPTNDFVAVQRFSLAKQEPDKQFMRKTIDSIKSIGIPASFAFKEYDQYLFLLYILILTLIGIIVYWKHGSTSNIPDVFIPAGMVLLLIIIISVCSFIV